MDRRDTFLRLAERCKNGDGLSHTHTHMVFWDALGELEKRLHRGTVKCCERQLQANAFESIVATLERELLPDGWRTLSCINSMDCRVEAGQGGVLLVTVYAPTEPLARLAALLQSLAEMEKE